jgi:hypothetical protein
MCGCFWPTLQLQQPHGLEQRTWKARSLWTVSSVAMIAVTETWGEWWVEWTESFEINVVDFVQEQISWTNLEWASGFGKIFYPGLEAAGMARTIAWRGLTQYGEPCVNKPLDLHDTSILCPTTSLRSQREFRNHGFWSRQRKHRRRSASSPEWQPCRAISEEDQDQKDAQCEHGARLPEHAAEGGLWKPQKGIFPRPGSRNMSL